jgi:hypothetical protein
LPGHERIAGNELADQLARSGSEHPFTGPEPTYGISIGAAKEAVSNWLNRENIKHWESIIGLTGKGTYIRTLCQKNKGPVKAEQGPIKMESGSIHRTLSSKGTPFQDGTDERSHM